MLRLEAFRGGGGPSMTIRQSVFTLDAILIDGARRVIVEGLTVEGGGDAIRAPMGVGAALGARGVFTQNGLPSRLSVFGP